MTENAELEGEHDKFYIVYVKEVHIQPVEVYANSPEQARERVCDGDGNELTAQRWFEYALDSDTWDVKEAKDDILLR